MTEAIIKENGRSRFAVNIDVRGHRLTGDEPEDAGGKDLGPAPYDLLTAALGECTAMTMRWYAEKHQWPLESVEVHITHRKQDAAELKGTEGRSGMVDVFEKRITLHGAALTEEQHRKLLDVAAKCPVQKTLLSGPVIHTFE